METRKILIVTKTYPEISRKYGETVCTAGILLDNDEKPLHWIRIYPVRFRELDERYPKWSIISASIERNHKDNRWESYRIDDSSIRIIRRISTSHQWEERRSYFEPFLSGSINEMKNQQKSIGLVKPRNIQYSYEATDRNWPESKQIVLDQGDLFRGENPFLELEKIPYKFYYQFEDGDGSHK